MPEGIEIEYYRETAELVVGRTVAQVQANDAWYLKGGLTSAVAKRLLVGQRVEAARRVGKLLLLDLSDSTLGLRFGMTGRLLVDGESAIERLEYSSGKNDPAWDRFALTFGDGGVMSMRDPRRLGGVALDPDEHALGVDLFSVTPGNLRKALANATPALKARLLDQKRIAGLGNLLTDEILWRAGLDPRRQAGSLSDAELRRLHRHLRATVVELKELGGSHMGKLQDHRIRGGQCPKDGEPLERYTIGGRTTYSCPVHQSGQTR